MDINEEVLIFFRKELSKKIDKNYVINNPNYLGDEANFLLEDFFKKFDIQSGYLEVDKYFNPLPSPMGCLWSWIIFNFPKSEQKYPIITIAHMIEVAKRKEWFDPE
jgi:hypothetical protein